MIVIIDYGLGNLGSILNMLKRIGVDSIISNDKKLIENADKIILPGVGSFDSGMSNLKKAGLVNILERKVLVDKVPFLGICLGMQLITRKSEEGELNGLGWIDAETKKFDSTIQDKKMIIPHMGWNKVYPVSDCLLFNDMDNEMRFYFVHSYYVHCENKEEIAGETDYGSRFTSVIQKENIFATQFHPEKSHKYGLTLLKNFVGL
ncbi:MAG: imidazole glycerol phosphate synthase subunit HisH [Ignavibacteriaceae bacterium]|jgi:glutamine amidotransferase